MTIEIHTDKAQLITTYYDPAAPAPTRFFIWFEKLTMVVVANAGETPAETWQRVLQQIYDRREYFMQGTLRDPEWKTQRYMLRGNPSAHAHVFAGVPMPDELGKQLFKRWVIWWCFQMACPSRNPDHEARVAALALIARIEGWYAPQREQVTVTPR